MAHGSVNPLVMALAAGEPDAYAALYDRLGAPLFRFAQALLRDAAEAEDAVQDLFVELVRRRQHLRQVADLEAYVFAMLRYALLRRRKRRSREERAMRGWAPMLAATETATADIELERALEKLPAAQREVIALKINGELTFAQIGEVLEVSAHTAASRYRYALEKLRNYLDVEA